MNENVPGPLSPSQSALGCGVTKKDSKTGDYEIAC